MVMTTRTCRSWAQSVEWLFPMPGCTVLICPSTTRTLRTRHTSKRALFASAGSATSLRASAVTGGLTARRTADLRTGELREVGVPLLEPQRRRRLQVVRDPSPVPAAVRAPAAQVTAAAAAAGAARRSHDMALVSTRRRRREPNSEAMLGHRTADGFRGLGRRRKKLLLLASPTSRC